MPEHNTRCLVCKTPQDYPAPAGTNFTGSPGWGSRYDGILRAEEKLEILICDDCLMAHQDLITKVTTVRPPEPKRTRSPWNPQ